MKDRFLHTMGHKKIFSVLPFTYPENMAQEMIVKGKTKTYENKKMKLLDKELLDKFLKTS